MPEIAFRPVERADLPMLAGWLSDPRVAQWWGDPDRQIAMIAEDLALPEMRQLIAFRDDVPLGYAQCYPAHHWPAPHLADVPADGIAIDLFNGPQGWGRGGTWLGALADLLLQDSPVLVIDPPHDNLRAIRAYRKAGFRGDSVRSDSEGQLTRIMTRRR